MGDLGATYDDHLRLVGKRVGDFLLILVELVSLGLTAEALGAIIGLKSAISLQRGPVDPKFQVERVAPTNHSSQKTRLNVLSYGKKILIDFSSVLSQFTRLRVGRTDRQTDDRRTDRILIGRPRLHSMQRGKNVRRGKLRFTIYECFVEVVYYLPENIAHVHFPRRTTVQYMEGIVRFSTLSVQTTIAIGYKSKKMLLNKFY